ncbi:MAG: zinc ribbon domain-containing protein [Nocardiopsaceae bacterium]|nr:zinc ribbon domain-containing protein [Nocardiopsaceae bacterium]
MNVNSSPPGPGKQATPMWNCGNCGQSASPGDQFCMRCGTPFPGSQVQSSGPPQGQPPGPPGPPSGPSQGPPPPGSSFPPPPANCGNCGQPASPGDQFCMRCGTPFPGSEIPPWGQSPGAFGGRSRSLTVVLCVVGVLALAGVGVGTWFLVGHAGSHASANGNQKGNTTKTTDPSQGPASQGPSSPSPSAASPSLSSSPSAPAPSKSAPPGPVTVASSVAGNPKATSVTKFLDRYFNAVNQHDYQAYMALVAPGGPGLSQSKFNSGYAGVTDTGETLTGISTAAGGQAVAQVTFTSHQGTAESPTKTTCDHWSISLYLTPASGGYQMVNPPSSYRAKYNAC